MRHISFLCLFILLFYGHLSLTYAQQETDRTLEKDSNFLLRVLPPILANSNSTPRSDSLSINMWSPSAGSFINPDKEFTISANVSYELKTQSSATLELSVYRCHADNQCSRWSWDTEEIIRGSGYATLSSSFGAVSTDAYMVATCVIRQDEYTLLATSQWSGDYPIINPEVANPKNLYNWSPTWIEFYSDKPRLFSLLGNSYSYVSALETWDDDVRVIPLVGRIGPDGELEAVNPETEKNEYIAAMQYALMRFGDFDGFGHLNSSSYWRDKADAMAEAAEASDPSQANAGVYFLSTGKSLFMIGVGLLTGGTGIITSVGSILELGSFMLDMYTNVLSDPDMGNDLGAATILTNLVSPRSYSDSDAFPSSDMHDYVLRGVSASNELVSMNNYGLEALSFLTETKLVSENDLSSSIDIILSNKDLTITHHLQGVKLLQHPYHVTQAAALGFAKIGVTYAVEKLADIGPYCKNMLANLQYHYNTLSIAADSIAHDIDAIPSITDSAELQNHLALLSWKIDLWYKCWHETVKVLYMRLREVDKSGWHSWMLSESEVESIGEAADYWEDYSLRLSNLVDDAAISIDYMLSYGNNAGGGETEENLIAYYPFNGSAYDASGNGHDGIVNGATLTFDKNSNPDSAYFFDGNNDYIFIGDLEYSSLNDYTISVWIRPDTVNKRQDIIGNYSSNRDHQGHDSLTMMVYSSDNDNYAGQITFLHRDSDKYNGGNYEAGDFISSSVEIETGNVYNIVVVRDTTSDSMRMYLNGVLQSELTSLSQNAITASTDWRIGYLTRPEGKDVFFQGLIDDIRIYNRGLTTSEVAALYDGSDPPEFCTYSLTPASASFDASGGSGSVSVDASSTDCSWTAKSNASWINITSGSSSTGDGMVAYTVDENTADTSRSGSLTIAGKSHSITQSAGTICDVLSEETVISPADRYQKSFGDSVSVAGDYLLVGARHSDYDSVNYPSYAGAAYIFQKAGSSWVQVEKFMAEDQGITNNDYFGISLAMTEDATYAIIGSPGSDVQNSNSAGLAYIYKRSGTSWARDAIIQASDPSNEHAFGKGVCIADNFVVAIGYSRVNIQSAKHSAVYIFERSGDSWTETGKFFVEDDGEYVELSGDVAISGEYLYVTGTDADDIEKVYVFQGAGASWSPVAELTSDDGNPFFTKGGMQVSGDYIIVGANGDSDDGIMGGAAYIFKRTGDSWSQTAKLTAIETTSSSFGDSVAISAEYALVGGYVGDYKNIHDSAYLYKRSREAWSLLKTIKPSENDGLYGRFGESSALSEDFVVVGNHNNMGANRGAVHVYTFCNKN